jgi:hypothetical protein
MHRAAKCGASNASHYEGSLQHAGKGSDLQIRTKLLAHHAINLLG